MSTRYHVTPKGNPGPCGAEKGNCPYGSSEDHYDSPEAAREAFEAAQDAVPEIVSRRANKSAMVFQEFDPREAPLTEEEEEALLPDDDDDETDTRAPKAYRDLSQVEVEEVLHEQAQEQKYHEEDERIRWAHRWD